MRIKRHALAVISLSLLTALAPAVYAGEAVTVAGMQQEGAVAVEDVLPPAEDPGSAADTAGPVATPSVADAPGEVLPLADDASPADPDVEPEPESANEPLDDIPDTAAPSDDPTATPAAPAAEDVPLGAIETLDVSVPEASDSNVTAGDPSTYDLAVIAAAAPLSEEVPAASAVSLLADDAPMVAAAGALQSAFAPYSDDEPALESPGEAAQNISCSVELSTHCASLGEAVVVRPVVTGSDDDYVYHFVWFTCDTFHEGGWYTDDTIPFVAPEAGFYIAYVYFYAPDGNVTCAENRFEVQSGWRTTDVVVTPTGDVLGAGQQAVIEAKINGLAELVADYHYVWCSNDVWTDGGWSNDPTSLFLPSLPGVYNVYVMAYDTDGYSQIKSTTVTVEGAWQAKDIAFGYDAGAAYNTPVTVTPVIDGTVDGTTFHYVWTHDGMWSDGGWTTSPTFTFTPEEPGIYTFYVGVYGADGNVGSLTKSYIAGSSWACEGIDVQFDGIVCPGATGLVVANVIGNAADLSYHYVWQFGNEWIDGGWSKANTAQFVPDRPGVYGINVIMYGPDGSVQTAQTPVEVKPAWNLVGLVFDGGNYLEPYSPVSVSPVVDGDTLGMSAHYVMRSGDSWYDGGWVTDLGAGLGSGAFTLGAQGLYEFYVDVYDTFGNARSTSTGEYLVSSSADVFSRVYQLGITQLGNLDGSIYEDALLAAGGQLCQGQRFMWCATYIWWCFDRSGCSEYLADGQVLSEPNDYSDFYKERGVYSYTMDGVETGDLLFWTYPGWEDQTTTGHMALCVGYDDEGYYALESNMLGDCTVVNYYPNDYLYSRGYARMTY